MNVKAIVTDIEGTTSSISFVHEVLFPYASQALSSFVGSHLMDARVVKILDDVRAEADEADANAERTIEILLGWIREDRKATPLKELQGHIWKHGYESGEFTGHVYDDAVRNLRRWSDDGMRLFVYSSGSIGAQKLLFGFSDAGDLTPLFEGYFDTQTGPKMAAASYREIAKQIQLDAAEILFLSDVADELDAAQSAGMNTLQLVRDDKVVPGTHPVARDFDAVQSLL
ncbi:MAG: enolase-phosphatase E1 [Woeseiaceae bacterium]|jgi:enolase-phosphatase E1